MFNRFFGRKGEAPDSALPAIRNITLGRTVMLDTLAWRRFGDALRFPLDRDTLIITAQGLVELSDGGFVHRFYTDDDMMFQAVSNDREGQDVTDITVFAPWDSAYPGGRSDRDAWLRRLRAPSFTAEGLPEYRRLWFGDEAAEQAPVTFWEDVHDDRDGVPDRRIFQTCMLFARDLPGDGRELLLALEMEPQGGDVSFEIMLGVPLELGEFKA
ncbi:MAG: hypothetical protein JWP92_1656 [Caulobacter sp.]|nr:hypothetical protein [Caulobacter sp.]